jgi:tetratricopeptide (TPR) repeat protein
MKAIKKLTMGLFLTAMGGSAMAQLPNWGCSDEVQQQMLEPVSIYQENVKQYKASKDSRYLEEAYPFWQQIVANCPKQSKNLYNNGTNIMKVKIAKAKDDAEREALIDELLRMYDIRIANYGEAAKYTAKKALDLEEILKENGLDRYYPLYDQAVKMDGELEAAYLVKYMEATINYVRAGKAEPTLVVDNYDIASEKLEDELQKFVDDSVKSATIRGYIAGVEAAFSPYATCDQLVEIYSKKFEADPENVDLLKKITNIMSKKGCTDQPLFFSATENLYRLEPTPSTALNMGQMCLQKKQYSKAVEYLSDAVKGVETQKDKYKAYLYLGHAYNGNKSFSAARNAYNSAAEVDRTKGEPYRYIALLYASSSSSATEDNVNGRSVYWAAVDKLQRSKSVDPSEENVEACNKLIGQFSAHFPKQTDAFMAGLENGNRFTVPGWVGESTTVRTR